MNFQAVTRAEARGDLRLRLRELTRSKLEDTELNRWLYLGTVDAYNELKGVSPEWYGHRFSGHEIKGVPETDILAATIDAELPEAGEIRKIIDVGTGDLVPRRDIRDYEGLVANQTYEGTAGFYCQRGNKLIFTHLQKGAIVDVYYVAKPTEAATDSAYLFIQEEFQDLAIMFAQRVALSKLGLTEHMPELDDEIADVVGSIKRAYSTEIQRQQLQQARLVKGR